MKKLSVFIFALGLVLAVLWIGGHAGQSVQAQGGGAACATIVDTAITALDDLCNGLERNAACYGHNRVDATFWQARDGLVFGSPADRVPLADVESIATSPLDVDSERWGVALLHAQADLPDVLPGQAVTFLLMGDTTVQNEVSPDALPDTGQAVDALTTAAANLRTRPSTNANIPLSLPADTPLTLIGTTDNGEWYQVYSPEFGRLWVFHTLVTTDNADGLAALPVTYGPDAPPRYGPMQAFYFTTGLGAPSCSEAPNALVVQNSARADITLNINDLDVTIGSTVVLTFTNLPGSDVRALVMTLLEGGLTTEVNGVPVGLHGAGDTVIITVGEDDNVNEESRVITMDAADLLPVIQAAAQAAGDSGLFDSSVLPEDFVDLVLNLFTPPPAPVSNPPTATPDGSASSALGEWGACGSCSTCGFNPDECVVSPDGSCVWDPGRCHVDVANPLTVLDVVCPMTSVFTTATYNPTDGSTISTYNTGGGSANIIILSGSPISANSFSVSVTCSTAFSGETAVGTASVTSTNGDTYTATFNVSVP